MDREGLACYLLGFAFEESGSLTLALDSYRTTVKLYDKIRSLLQSEDDWKTHFRDNNRKGYTALWRSLLKLELTDEALHAAEQGSAQRLTDLLRVQYGLTVSPAASSEPREMISSMIRNLSTQAVFLSSGRKHDKFLDTKKGKRYPLLTKGN